MVDELHSLRERIEREERSSPSPPARRDPIEQPSIALADGILAGAAVVFVAYVAMLVAAILLGI